MEDSVPSVAEPRKPVVPPRLRLDRIVFLGPQQEPAEIRLDERLTVVCGASDTGKSFLVESVDFALGRSTPPRDIPQRVGYDRLRLQLGIADTEYTWTLERALAGGAYRLASGVVPDGSAMPGTDTLRDKHKHESVDNISGWLIEKIGLSGARIQKNKDGETNSLSFRNLGKLLLVDEEDIIAQRSPFLSGQYTTGTSEYAALKLLLTGVDDSGLVNVRAVRASDQDTTSKINLLEQMIASLEDEIEDVPDESDLQEQLDRLDASITQLAQRVGSARQDANEALQRRQEITRALERSLDRLAEIEELLERFSLLGLHYRTDVERLEAMQEGGSLFVHLDSSSCPLCGALPAEQRHDQTCDADVPTIVRAADAEINKIEILATELDETTTSLTAEQALLSKEVEDGRQKLETVKAQLDQILSPNLDEAVGKFRELADMKSEANQQLQLYRRLETLIAQRDDLLFEEEAESADAVQTDLSQSVIDEFAQEVHSTLRAWNFPGGDRLHFDTKTRDFVLDGKPRASFGKGFRAITHAAVTLSLMRFCLDRSLPHPGFVLLDSPLLSYWKPEDDSDSLRLAGSDLKERFYRFLATGQARGQVIVVENEHPPADETEIHSIIFTRNPNEGRYGLFPQ
jgi:hypothetical protein